MEDHLEGLSDYEKEALDRAEKKFLSRSDEDHRFKALPLIAQRHLHGTWFSCYRAGVDTTELSEELAHLKMVIHSEQNRFRYLCDLAMRFWLPEHEVFYPALLAADYRRLYPTRAFSAMSADLSARYGVDFPDGFPAADELGDYVATLGSFGIAAGQDHYSVGYEGGSFPPQFFNIYFFTELLFFFRECYGVVLPDSPIARVSAAAARALVELRRETRETAP